MDESPTLTLGPIIGRGARAEVYALGADRALKLYWAGKDPASVEGEARAVEFVHTAGLPVPRCFGTVTIDGRHGIVFQRISGPSMLQRLLGRPWEAGRLARQLAGLQATMHGIEAPEPNSEPRQRQALHHRLAAARQLSADVLEAARAALGDLPDGDALCHGDFHPDNIMLGPDGPVIIDWQEPTWGSPAADVARTLLLLRNAPLHVGARGSARRLVVGLLSSWFARAYLRHYLRVRPLDRELVERWIPVLAAARLCENIAVEEEWLSSLARRLLPRSRP